MAVCVRAQRDVILADWDMGEGCSFGDRRQEIVFIGVGMDEAKICEQVGQRVWGSDGWCRGRFAGDGAGVGERVDGVGAQESLQGWSGK